MNKHTMARHDGGSTESTAKHRVAAAGDAQGARPLPVLSAPRERAETQTGTRHSQAAARARVPSHASSG